MTMMERLGVFRQSLWGAFLLAFSICGYAVASPSLSVENVSFRQRYPWNGFVDIDCTVKCSDPTTNVSLHVTAKDTVANRSLVVRNVRLDSEDPTGGVDGLTVTAGTHRIVWDAGADNPNFVSDTVTVEVQALLGTGLYLVVDLSGGTDADSYPVSYLGAEPQGGWTDEKLKGVIEDVIETALKGSLGKPLETHRKRYRRSVLRGGAEFSRMKERLNDFRAALLA